jgi:cytochrome c oxidase subunit II
VITSPVGVGFFPQASSDFAEQWDTFFWVQTLIIAAGGAIVFGMLTVFCFRYARKEGVATPRILGSVKLEFLWTVIPLILFLGLFVYGVYLYNVATTIPEDHLEVFVVGKQWMWKIQHKDGGVREINELHVPIDTNIKITVISEDVIHDFGLPAFRQKIDVVPGRYVSTWFRATKEGESHIFCDQYCGQGHSQMVGKVYVLSQANFEAWKEGTYISKKGQNAVDGSAAWEGEKLFKKLHCITCHNGEGGQRAPNLFGIYGSKITLANGELVTADHAYLRNSIRNPLSQIHAGWQPIMPAYPPSQLSESEINSVISYLRSKKLGDTYPVRVDDSPNQTGAPVNETSKPPVAPIPGTDKK